MDRQTDISGVSGTGTIVEGIEFSDGRVVLRWLVEPSSIAMYASITDVQAIHGHDGATTVRWVDDAA